MEAVNLLQAQDVWCALVIGNSRLHWAQFEGETLQETWDTNHLPTTVGKQLGCNWTLDELPPDYKIPFKRGQGSRGAGEEYLIQKPKAKIPLFLASVVPQQTDLWQTYPETRVIALNQVPLQGVYPTFGIDRALAVWGAGETWGWPILVIDGGTALTFTGADAYQCLMGGAILPGLGLQLQSLAEKTAGLPIADLPQQLPPRWASNTIGAIQSGIIYTVLAGIQDFIQAWWQDFPGSRIVFTGGDQALLLAYVQSHFPEKAAELIADQHLIFWGIRACRRI